MRRRERGIASRSKMERCNIYRLCGDYVSSLGHADCHGPCLISTCCCMRLALDHPARIAWRVCGAPYSFPVPRPDIFALHIVV